MATTKESPEFKTPQPKTCSCLELKVYHSNVTNCGKDPIQSTAMTPTEICALVAYADRRMQSRILSILYRICFKARIPNEEQQEIILGFMLGKHVREDMTQSDFVFFNMLSHKLMKHYLAYIGKYNANQESRIQSCMIMLKTIKSKCADFENVKQQVVVPKPSAPEDPEDPTDLSAFATSVILQEKNAITMLIEKYDTAIKEAQSRIAEAQRKIDLTRQRILQVPDQADMYNRQIQAYRSALQQYADLVGYNQRAKNLLTEHLRGDPDAYTKFLTMTDKAKKEAEFNKKLNSLKEAHGGGKITPKQFGGVVIEENSKPWNRFYQCMLNQKQEGLLVTCFDGENYFQVDLSAEKAAYDKEERTDHSIDEDIALMRRVMVPLMAWCGIPPEEQQRFWDMFKYSEVVNKRGDEYTCPQQPLPTYSDDGSRFWFENEPGWDPVEYEEAELVGDKLVREVPKQIQSSFMPTLKIATPPEIAKLAEDGVDIKIEGSGKAAEALHKISEEGIKLKFELTESMKSAIANLSSAYQSLRQSLSDNSPDLLRTVETLVGTLAALFTLFRTEDRGARLGVIVMYVTLTHGVTGVSELLGELNTIVDFTSHFIGMSPHAGDEEEQHFLDKTGNVFTNVLPVFAHMLGVQYNRDIKYDKKHIDNFVSHIKLLRVTHDVYGFLLNFMKEGLISIYERYTGVPYCPLESEALVQEVIAWIAEAEKVMVEDSYHQAKFNFTLLPKIKSLVLQGTTLNERISLQPLIQRAVAGFPDTLSRLRQLNSQLDELRRMQRPRRVPLATMIVGPSGVGKESATDFLNAYIQMATSGKPYDPNDTYTRHISQEYWDSYYNQRSVIVTDFGQNTTLEHLNILYTEIISVVNDAMFGTHMAPIKDKGTQFTSDIFFCNCNPPPFVAPSQAGIKSDKAVKSRFHRIYYLNLKSNCEADAGKNWDSDSYEATNILRDDKVKPIDPNVWVFFRCDKDGKIIKGHRYSFIEVADELVQIWFRLENGIGSVRQNLAKDQAILEPFVSKIREEMLKMEPLKERIKPLEPWFWDSYNSAYVTRKQAPSKEIQCQTNGPDCNKDDCSEYKVRQYVANQIKHTSAPSIPLPVIIHIPDLEKDQRKKLITRMIERLKEIHSETEKKVQETKVQVGHYLRKVGEALFGDNKLAKVIKAFGALAALGTLAFGIDYGARRLLQSSKPIEGLSAVTKHAQSTIRSVQRGRGPALITTQVPVQDLFKEIHAGKEVEETKEITKEIQSSKDRSDLLRNVLRPAYCTLMAAGRDGIIRRTGGIFIMGRIGMTVEHFVTHLWKQGPMTIIDGTGKKWTIPRENFHMFHAHKLDITFFYVDEKTMPMHRNITMHFIVEADKTIALNGPVTIPVRDLNADIFIAKTGLNPRWGMDEQYRSDMLGLIFTCAQSVEVETVTEPGDCGHVGVTSQTAFQRPFLGLLVAGDGRKSLIALCTQECIKYAVAELLKRVEPRETITKEAQASRGRVEISAKPYDINEAKVKIDPSTLKNNIVDIKLVDKMPEALLGRRSNIRRSPIHGKMIKPIEYPAVLAPKTQPDGRVVDPALNAFEKFNHDVVDNSDHALLERIFDYMLETIPYKIRPRVLTVEESVAGVRGWDYTPPMTRNTSGGYPLNVQPHKKPGKGDFIVWDDARQMWIPTEEFRSLIEERDLFDHTGEHNGIEPTTILTFALKDERLPMRKIATLKDPNQPLSEENVLEWIAKPRTMNGVEADELAHSRRYFGAFHENLYQSHNESFSLPGVNLDNHYESRILFDRLTQFSKKNFIGGDLKSCDSVLPEIVMRFFTELINRWYENHPEFSLEEKLQAIEDSKIRTKIFERNCHPIIILLNVLIWISRTNPSGWEGTTDYNGGGLFALLVYCLIITAREKGIDLTLEQAFKIVKSLFTFGDDHGWGLPDGVATFFSMKSVRDVLLSHFGITYTGVEKDAEIPDFYDIENLVVLCRTFRWDQGGCFTPLSEDMIRDSTNWVNVEGGDYQTSFNQNNLCALRMMYHHGEQKFEQFKKELNKHRKDAGYPVIQLEYDTCVASHFGYSNLDEKHLYVQAMDLTKHAHITKEIQSSYDDKQQRLNRGYKFISRLNFNSPTLDDHFTQFVSGMQYTHSPSLRKDVAAAHDHYYNVIGANGFGPYAQGSDAESDKSTADLIFMRNSMAFWAYWNSWRFAILRYTTLFVVGLVFGLILQALMPVLPAVVAFVPKEIQSSGGQPKTTEPLPNTEQVTNPQATQLTETVSFGDNAGKETPALTVKADTPIPKLGDGNDPYTDQTPKSFLQRPYVVSVINWSGATAQGDLITSLSFPKLLFDVMSIEEKLNRFQYFRATVVLEFRINGTSFHFGDLLIAWVPHYTEGTALNYAQDIYTASSLDHVHLSANNNFTATIKIPYVAPSNYWNMKDDPATTADGFFGKVYVFAFSPLRLVGGGTTPALKVMVTANFENVEAAGWGLRDSVAKKLSHMKEIHSGKTHVRSMEQEMKTKAKTQASIASEAITPVVAEIKDIVGIGRDLMSIGIGALDKPTEVQIPTKILPIVQSGLANANGSDSCEPLSMDIQNKVSTQNIYGTIKDYTQFSNYKLLPSLLALGSFDGTAQYLDRILTVPVTPTLCYHASTVTDVIYRPTHVANLALFFKYWRGGLKYHLLLHTSKFITGRLGIKWLPDPTYTGAITNSEFGDTVMHVVDFTGDTSYSFTIPHLKKIQWEKVLTLHAANNTPVDSWDGFNGQVVFQLLNPLTSGDSVVEAEVFYGLYVSGAEDFEVARPNGLPPDIFDGTTPVDGGLRKQQVKQKLKGMKEIQSGMSVSSDIRKLFETPFPTLIPTTSGVTFNLDMGESVTSWLDLMKRFTRWRTEVPTGTNAYAYTEYVYPIIGDVQVFARIMRTFLFWRGSIRHKIQISNLGSAVVDMVATNTVQTDQYDTSFGITGVTEMTSDKRAWMEVQVPFYHPFNMVCRSQFTQESLEYPGLVLTLSNYTSVATNFSGRLDWYIAAGDDFSMGWPVCPVVLAQPIPPPKKTP